MLAEAITEELDFSLASSSSSVSSRDCDGRGLRLLDFETSLSDALALALAKSTTGVATGRPSGGT